MLFIYNNTVYRPCLAADAGNQSGGMSTLEHRASRERGQTLQGCLIPAEPLPNDLARSLRFSNPRLEGIHHVD